MYEHALSLWALGVKCDNTSQHWQERHTKRRKCVVLLSATDGADCHGAPIESCSAKAGHKSPSPPHCSRVLMVQKAEGLTISSFIKSHLN